MALQVSRRTLLGAVAGVGATGAVGYGGARVAAEQGTVVVRHIGGRTTTDDGQQRTVDVFHEELNNNGTVNRRFDPAFRSVFPDSPPMTVSDGAHETLTGRLTDVTYWLGHRCPGAQCSTPQVRRREFNATRPGEEVRLLYHGARATIVPP